MKPINDLEQVDVDLPRRSDTSTARRDRAARRTRELATLLAKRSELRGVYPPADLVDDALRWSA